MTFDATFPQLERRLQQVGEGDAAGRSGADALLRSIGLVSDAGLTEIGEKYYLARFIAQDDSRANGHMAEALRLNAAVNAFCEATWPYREIPVAGALNLLRRLGMAPSEIHAKRWLELMGRAGLITHNRNRAEIHVIYNPSETGSATAGRDAEILKGHLLSPDTPYSNILALRKVLRSGAEFLYWYEAHMGDKVLEVLLGEIQADQLKSIRLLSGPAQIRASTRGNFARFQAEFSSRRRIFTEWRVLPKEQLNRAHGRFIVTDRLARNLPPLNLILKGTTDEILPSEFSSNDFDALWLHGIELAEWSVPAGT